MKINLTENTKVTINLIRGVVSLVFLVTITIAVAGWKTNFEDRVSALERHNVIAIESRKEIKLLIDQRHNEVLREIKRLQEEDAKSDTLAAKIITDLEWMRLAIQRVYDEMWKGEVSE